MRNKLFKPTQITFVCDFIIISMNTALENLLLIK